MAPSMKENKRYYKFQLGVCNYASRHEEHMGGAPCQFHVDPYKPDCVYIPLLTLGGFRGQCLDSVFGAQLRQTERCIFLTNTKAESPATSIIRIYM